MKKNTMIIYIEKHFWNNQMREIHQKVQNNSLDYVTRLIELS